MSIFDSIEKLITEHGSAAILSQQLAFARDQFDALERKVSELQIQIGRTEALLERERSDHKQEREELQRLEAEHAEEVRIHRSIEFRRGKRTAGRWLAFCPVCHMPASNHEGSTEVSCSNRACKWVIFLDDIPMSRAIGEVDQAR